MAQWNVFWGLKFPFSLPKSGLQEVPGFPNSYDPFATKANVPYVGGEVVVVSPGHFYRPRRMILGSKMPF
jgi:hypothetical protein